MSTPTESAGAQPPGKAAPPGGPGTPGGVAPHPALTGSDLVLATLGLSLATFMNVLDTTIANVSIPAISGDVGVSTSQGTWVITSFGVANAIAVPLTGWLTQRFGQVRLFTASVLLFVLASLLCGLASNLEMLIAFRVMQGLVAGPMTPLSQALLLQCFPRNKASMALAMWGMTATAAPVFGPVLGGLLTDHLSWPWIFYINIPVGLFSAWLSWRMLRHRESPTRRIPIDFMGLMLLALWVGALQILLDRGRELDWFSSDEIVVLGVVALVAFSIFLVWELTDAHPIIQLRLFQRRNFTFGTLALALGYGVFFGNVVLIPLWLQEFMGYTATWAGLVTAPVGVVAMLSAPVVGKLMHSRDPRLLAGTAFGIFALVSFMRAGFDLGVDAWPLVQTQLIQGLAMATFFTPLTAITLSGLAPDQVAGASGLSNFLRIMLGAVGSSVYTTLWDRRASLHHAQLTEHINPYSSIVQESLSRFQSLGQSALQSLGSLEREISRQAFMMSADDLFWMSGLLFLLLSGTVWLTQRPGAMGHRDAGGAH